jgi:hypothetical protein
VPSAGVVANAGIKVDEETPASVNVDLGLRQASTTPMPISNANQPEEVQENIAQSSEPDNAATLSLPDHPVFVLDTAPLLAEGEHLQLSLPTVPPDFSFGLMNANVPALPVSMEPSFGRTNSNSTLTSTGDFDSSSPFSNPSSTPATKWPYPYTDSSMGYNNMLDQYINPMSQYVAGGQPIRRTCLHITFL